MELKLLRPFDMQHPDIDQEPIVQLKDRQEFSCESDWVIYQAKVFYELFRDSGEAMRLLEARAKEDERDARIHFCLAECYSRDCGGLARSLDCCEKGLAINAKSDYGHTIRARVELSLDRPFEAYLSAMAALKLNSRNFEAGFYLGTIGFAIATSEGNVEKMKLSNENLRTTLSLNPDSASLTKIIVENEAILRKID